MGVRSLVQADNPDEKTVTMSFFFFLLNLPSYEIQTNRARRQSSKIKLRKIKFRQKVIVSLSNVDFVAAAKPSVGLILFSQLLL